MRRSKRFPKFLHETIIVAMTLVSTLCWAIENHEHPYIVPETGLGEAHLSISCSKDSSKIFDTGLVLLHNFWYSRALNIFKKITDKEPECAIAYWGAAMTFNHPFWDAPTPSDRRIAQNFIAKGMLAKVTSEKEKSLLDAARLLFDGDTERNSRDEKYNEAMGRIYSKFPENEMKLFFALSIMGTIKEGTKGFERQGKAANLLEEVFEKLPNHPGVLHYLVHVYDDPIHAQKGLQAARKYSSAAAAVPHALHMPSHIFTRLGHWTESAASNERAWIASEADVKRAGEPSRLRDFHSLNYLQYAYIQLGQFHKARSSLNIIASEFNSLSSKITATDTPELQSRHVRGRTIYSLPDRIVYGYFDMLTRYLFETKNWRDASNIPLLVPSDDFRAVKLHLECISAAERGELSVTIDRAIQLRALAMREGHHPFVDKIINMMALEAEAFSSLMQERSNEVIDKMRAAVAIEDSIDSLSQPPYPIIPANELFGDLLMKLNRPLEAREHYVETLKRTPNRPMAIFGAARAHALLGEREEAKKLYRAFLELWKTADTDRSELLIARKFLVEK